jgi:hypothetical protein
MAYGTPILPYDLGSGGGNADRGAQLGGRGGGVVNITAAFLNVLGVISANGLSGESANTSFPNGAGGGSGGSINIIAFQVNISEFSDGIHADGGDGGRTPRRCLWWPRKL